MELIKDVFLVRADKDAKQITSIKGHSGTNLVLDTDFQKYNHATQIGVVAHSPKIIDSEYLNDNPVKDGDEVLFHHFVCQEDNQVIFNEEIFYQCEYFHIWAKIVNSKLEPLEDYIFVEPVLESEENMKTGGGLILRTERQPLKNVGKVFALSKQAKKCGLRMGDIVFFTNDADYDIRVVEKDLYRMCIRNIIGIERNGQLVCMTNKMLVEDVTENTQRGGLIYRRNERERTGIVRIVGEDIKHISIGTKISYFNGLASRLNYLGKEYSFLTLQEINYNTMTGQPYLNRVLIEQDEAQGTTNSGLIIPDNGKEKPFTGTIANIGPDVKVTSIGAKVMYHKNKGAEVVIDGKDYLLMMENDLLYNL